MRKMKPANTAFQAILPAAALAMGAAPLHAQDAGQSEGETELAELLEGRVAGEPQKCISGTASDSIQIIDETAMVFRSGSTIYVNRPHNARFLDWNDVPVIERYSAQLCKQDRVELRDRFSLMRGPILILGQFTPYEKTGGDDS